MSQRRTTLIELITIAGFCAFLFYFGLSAFGLVGADEPRYAQIAREMLERHDVITPTLYGEPWLEKPPLYYWRAMEAYWALGVNDWAARAPSATAATLMLAVIYFFLRRFRPGAQLNGALMTAASAAVIGFARGAGTDMLVTAAFAVGLLLWFAWYVTERRLWLALFYVFMAFGTLAKGPVAPFLAAVIIIIFTLVRRDVRAITRTLWIRGILLLLFVALPWYVAVQLRNPQFFREFILQHNLERFATNVYHHNQPFWYFIPVLLLGALPWTALVVAGWVEAIRDWQQGKAAERQNTLEKFLLIWTVVILVFFSISASKLPGYILPAIPACTILAAIWVADRERLGWPLIVGQGVFSGAVLCAALLYPSALVCRRAIPGEARWLGLGIGALIVLATVSTLARKGTAALRVVVLGPVILGLAFLLRVGAPVIDNALSARPIAREISQMERGRTQLAVFKAPRETEYGLAFYRNQPILRYERGEIPVQDHMVVAPEAYSGELVKAVSPRRASHLGDFTPQHLELFWVSTPVPMATEHQH